MSDDSTGDAEVIEAAAKMLAYRNYADRNAVAEDYREDARAVVTTVTPIIAKHAAAKALRDAADEWGRAPHHQRPNHPHTWLRRRALCIEAGIKPDGERAPRAAIDCAASIEDS